MLGFLQHLGGQIGAWFYLIAGGLVFAEAAVMVGLVLPGETSLLVAGFAAHQGWIALWPMVAIAIGSAVLGFASLIPYWLAARPAVGAGTVAQGVIIHAIGNALVLVLLLAPPTKHWIQNQVQRG